MDLYNMLQTGEGIEHLEEHLLDLDSEFRFKCRRCGKCCIHQDTIIFNVRDIYNIAKKKGMTMQAVVEAYTETYIGRNSRIPIIPHYPSALQWSEGRLPAAGGWAVQCA